MILPIRLRGVTIVSEPIRPVDRLNSKQRRCLEFVGQGLKYKEIGRRLELSHHTVEYHLSNAVKILGAATTEEAASIYLRSLQLPRPFETGGLVAHSVDPNVEKGGAALGRRAGAPGWPPYKTLAERLGMVIVVAVYTIVVLHYIGPPIVRGLTTHPMSASDWR